MNAVKAFFNAMKLAQKPAAIGFVTILGLGITTAFATVTSALLILLIPKLLLATKAAIFGYPLFITGLITLNIKQQHQKKEPPTIAMLPPCKPHEKHINQEKITNEILITPPPIESIFNLHTAPKQPTWQQIILNQIQPTTEIQDASQSAEALAMPGIDTALCRDAKPLNNQLALTTICWQAISNVSELLNKIKASEMKSTASELQIPKYRSMNKSQLLIEIVEAFNNAPAFS